MIRANFIRNRDNKVCGFKVTNHGDPLVCGAVSALVINAVNSIEKLTDEKIECVFQENGGYIEASASGMKDNGKASLLLQSLELGLLAIEQEFPKEIKITYTDG